MKNTKVIKRKNKRKISIKKVIKFINRLSLLLATATSLLYFMYIIVISIYNYLYNRPIRTAVLMVAFGVVMMFIDELDQAHTRAKQNRTKARQQARHTSTTRA